MQLESDETKSVDFIARFKAQLRDLLEEDYDDVMATEQAHWYLHEPNSDDMSPEEWAEMCASEYGPE